MLLGKDEDGRLHYRPYRTTVYNIEVEDTHTYLVGHAGILVHNTCGQTRSDRMAEIQARSKDSINRDVAEILRRDDSRTPLLSGRLKRSDGLTSGKRSGCSDWAGSADNSR